MVAESLDYLATELEKKVSPKSSKDEIEAAVKAVLKEVVCKHRRVVFDGDNYDPKWHEQAKERGLPHLKTTAQGLDELKSKETIDLFSKYEVLNERELRARYAVLLDRYTTTIGIEARTMISMINTHVLPAAIRYQGQIAESIAATKAAGITCEDTHDQLQDLVNMISTLRKATDRVAEAESYTAEDADRLGHHVCDTLNPAMEEARAAADAIELVLPDDLWTLPSYAEMLFMR